MPVGTRPHYLTEEEAIIRSMSSEGHSDKAIAAKINETVLHHSRKRSGISVKRRAIGVNKSVSGCYTPTQVCESLGIPYQTLRSWIRYGQVQAIPRGRFYYFNETQFLAIKEKAKLPPQFTLLAKDIEKATGVQKKVITRGAAAGYIHDHCYKHWDGWRFTRWFMLRLMEHMAEETYRGQPRLNIDWGILINGL